VWKGFGHVSVLRTAFGVLCAGCFPSISWSLWMH